MGRGVGLGVGFGVNTCTHFFVEKRYDEMRKREEHYISEREEELLGVLAKQVSPASHPDGAPVGQERAHELTASTHDVPQKFPVCCAFTATRNNDDDDDNAVIIISVVMEEQAVLAAVNDEVMLLLLLLLRCCCCGILFWMG